MFYMQVNRGKPVRIVRRPPSGLTEAELKDHGILPVVHNRPTIDPTYQEAEQLLPPEWSVHSDHVEVTYRITSFDLQEEREKACESIRRLRRLKEGQGVGWTFEGTELRLRTDKDTQAKIANVLTAMSLDPEMSQVDWEIQPGVWEPLTQDSMKLMAKEVTRHVQSVFSRSKVFEERLKQAEDLPGIREILKEAEEPGWSGD